MAAYFLEAAATLGRNFALGPWLTIDLILPTWCLSSPKLATYSVWPHWTQLLIGNSDPSSSIYGSVITSPLQTRDRHRQALFARTISITKDFETSRSRLDLSFISQRARRMDSGSSGIDTEPAPRKPAASPDHWRRWLRPGAMHTARSPARLWDRHKSAGHTPRAP